jgi:hypothetical protein
MYPNTALAQSMGPVRPRLEVADILRTHGEAYQKKHPLTKEQNKSMTDIQLCRTEALGGHLDVCDQGCGYLRISYNSCRNRNCPKCQALQSAKWLHKRLKATLPTKYFHVVVTVPHELNPLILQNQKTLYNILFRASAQSLLELTRDWKRLKAQVGFTAVLHTWNQDLLFHPHLHLVVTAGGLDPSQTRWIGSQAKFLIPVKALSKKIRGKFLHQLKQAFHKDKLVFRGTAQDLHDPNAFATLIDGLYGKKWAVYSKAPFAGPERVFKYLSRYTHRVAISNQRLRYISETHVTFAARDNQNPGKSRSVTVSPEEFIRRFLLHILPAGFTKIRHYGIMAPCNAKTKLALARKLIEETLPPSEHTSTTDPPEQDTTWQELYFHLTGIDLMLCPKCRKGRLLRHPLDAAHEHSTTSHYSPIFLDSS